MKPTRGRVVFYVSPGGGPFPAFITGVQSDGTVNLAVFVDAYVPVSGLGVGCGQLITRVTGAAEVDPVTDCQSATTGWFWPPRTP